MSESMYDLKVWAFVVNAWNDVGVKYSQVTMSLGYDFETAHDETLEKAKIDLMPEIHGWRGHTIGNKKAMPDNWYEEIAGEYKVRGPKRDNLKAD